MNAQIKLIKRIRTLKNRQYKLNNELNDIIENLQEICNHSDYEEKEMYIPGGYLDREEFHKWKLCKICDTRFDDEIIKGGFG